jgi:hypothetical protein
MSAPVYVPIFKLRDGSHRSPVPQGPHVHALFITVRLETELLCALPHISAELAAVLPRSNGTKIVLAIDVLLECVPVLDLGRMDLNGPLD